MARLAIVGERAVDRLLAALDESSASPETTVVILRTLELIGSPRVLPAAIARLTASNDAIAIAAVAAIRSHLRAADDAVASQSLEALTALALARERSDPPRLAALEALGDMGAETFQPILDRLRQDPSARVRRVAGADAEADADIDAAIDTGEAFAVTAPVPTRGRDARGSGARPTAPKTAARALARLEAAAHGSLPDEPETLRTLIADAGETVALSVLHDLVLTLRAKERSLQGTAGASGAATAGAESTTTSKTAAAGATPAEILDWMTARGAAHQALAERQSRLAVFDLRDTFEHASERLPLGFVAAITEVGDASCLPALAAAWRQVDDGWMRDHLASAFQAIMLRENLTRRHAVVRRALERAPEGAGALVVAPRRAGR